MSDRTVAQTSTWQHTTLTTNIHAPGGIRTLSSNKRAAADLRLRPRGHWDRHMHSMQNCNFACSFVWVWNLAEGVWEYGAEGVFGSERNKITWDWRKLHVEELNDLYCSPNIVRVIKSRRMRWAGYVARIGERRGVYRVLVGRPEGKGPLGRPRPIWR